MSSVLTFIMFVLVIGTPVALWHCLCTINQMSRSTHHGVRIAYVLNATGHFMVILAVLDFLHGDPMAWPWLLLAGVATTNIGVALRHAVTRRICWCPECLMRRQVLAHSEEDLL